MPPLSRRRNRRNTYFVDTKTTCFLCLQDIPPPPSPPPPVITLDEEEEENGGEHVGGVEDKGKEEGNREEESCQKRSKFCLRSICKYLRMDPWLSNKMAGGSLLDMIGVKLQNTDLLVTLCDDCTRVTTNLSKMCMELEILQMKVDQSLRDFAVVLEDSISKPNLMEEFKSKLAGPLEQLQASVAESMRNETKKKCYKRLDESLPRVILTDETAKNVSNRTGATVPNLIPITTSTTTSFTPLPEVSILNVTTEKSMFRPGQLKCNVCGLAFGSRSGLIQHKYRRHPHPSTTSTLGLEPYTCNACGTKLPSKAHWIRHSRLHCPFRGTNPTTEAPPQPPVEIPKLPEFDRSKVIIPTADVLNQMMNPLPHVRTVNNHLLCSLCPSNSYPYNSDDTLRRHLLTVHPDFLFRPVRLDEVTQNQFQMICDENIEKEVHASYQSDNEPDSRSYVCVHCSDAYYEKRSMIVHLIECHYELLASKLVDLQWSKITKNGNHSSSFLSTSRRPNIKLKSGRWKCPDCQAIFQQNSSLGRHRRRSCIIRDGGRLDDSKRRYNYIEIVPPPNAPVTKDGNVRKRRPPVGSQGKFKCLDCGAGFAHSTSLWRHRKLAKHMTGYNSNPLNRSLPQFKPPSSSFPQKDCPFACEFCGNKFSEQRYLGRHLRRTSCALKAQQNTFGNTGTDNNQLFLTTPAVPTPPPPPPVIMAPATFIQYAPAEVSTPPPVTPTETPGSKKWPCEHCGSILSSSSVLYRHQRKSCPILKAMQNQGDLSSAQFMEQNYFEEQGEEEMMDQREVYQDTYVNTKVEVLEMSQVQLSGAMEEDTMVVKTEDIFLDVRHGHHEGSYANIDENQQNESNMMILPDTEDPLQF